MEGGSEDEEGLNLRNADEDEDRPINEQDAYTEGRKARKRKGRRFKKAQVLQSDDNFDDDYQDDEQRLTVREGDFDENDRIIMQELRREEKKEKLQDFVYEDVEDEEEEEKDLSAMNPYQRAQYERHKKVFERLKKEQTPA